MTDKKDMVFLSMSTWYEWADLGMVNRSYHVFRQLRASGKVGKVLYVDFPPPTMKAAARRLFQDSRIAGEIRMKDYFWQVVEVEKDVFVLTIYWFFLQEKVVRIVEEVMERLAMHDTLLWSYNTLLPIFFERGKYSTKVFDAVDDWTAHTAHKGRKKVMHEYYQTIGKNADVIFTVSSRLAAKFPQKKTFVVPNGVDSAHFAQQADEPADIRTIPHPRVGYVGVIQDRMDFALLEKVVREQVNYSFVFVGWVWDEVQKERDAFSRNKNVFFLGKKMYAELPAYMQHIDVAIIPHKISALTKSMDPMKLYEYLACGKPVVATDIPLFLHAPFIHHAKDAETFSRLLADAVVAASAYACDARELAKKQQWRDRVHSMLEHVH